jgi:hypothetical protein
MFGLLSKIFGNGSKPAARRYRKPSNTSFKPRFEILEDRRLATASGMISSVLWSNNGYGHPIPFEFALASDHSLMEYSDNPSYGRVFSNLGGNWTKISAGLDSTGSPVCYAIAPDHTCWRWELSSRFTNLGGYVIDISATVNNEVYAIGWDHSLWVNTPSRNWQGLGGYVIQISAGKDTSGADECFALGWDYSLWLRNSGGWYGFGGYVTQLAGTDHNEVYAIAGDHQAWVHNSSGWHDLGGYVLQISAGVDLSGRDELFAIGGNNGVYVNNASGWHYLAIGRGGSPLATDIAACAGDACFIVDPNHAGWIHDSTGWHYQDRDQYGDTIL